MAHTPRLRRVTCGAVVAAALAVALGGCGVRDDLPVAGPQVDRVPRGVAPTPAGQAGQAGDMAPHEQENNGWKQRAPLTPADHKVATDAATRIRPVLERLRQAGDFRPESLRDALVDLGYPRDDVQIRAVEKSVLLPADAPAPKGVAYGVRVGYRGCVHGGVVPERSTADIGGPVKEWGCIDPGPTH